MRTGAKGFVAEREREMERESAREIVSCRLCQWSMLLRL